MVISIPESKRILIVLQCFMIVVDCWHMFKKLNHTSQNDHHLFRKSSNIYHFVYRSFIEIAWFQRH